MPTRGPRRLLIFDVDGTLLVSGRVTSDLFAAAFADVSGVLPQGDAVPFAGMTDRAIFRALLRATGQDGRLTEAAPANSPAEAVSPSAGERNGSAFDRLFARFAERFTARMRDVYPSAEGPRLLRGVPELLDALAKDERFALALGTGNIRTTAYIKLGRFALHARFPVGGFGGDHEDRGDVIRAALREARAHYGFDGDRDQAWVIGDTPADVSAARAAGTRAVAVASGFSPIDQLRAAEADVLLEDFGDTQRVLQALA